MSSLSFLAVFVAAVAGNAVLAIVTFCYAKRRGSRQTSAVSTIQLPASGARSGAAGARRLLFLAVYYSFLPIGHAQARLARAFHDTGLGAGWPLLVLWWPLRQAYRFGFRLCWTLRP